MNVRRHFSFKQKTRLTFAICIKFLSQTFFRWMWAGRCKKSHHFFLFHVVTVKVFPSLFDVFYYKQIINKPGRKKRMNIVSRKPFTFFKLKCEQWQDKTTNTTINKSLRWTKGESVRWQMYVKMWIILEKMQMIKKKGFFFHIL